MSATSAVPVHVALAVHVAVAVLVVMAALVAAPRAGAQVAPGAPDSAATRRTSTIPPRFLLPRDSLRLAIPTELLPFARLAPDRPSPELVADERVRSLGRAVNTGTSALWGQASSGGGGTPAEATISSAPLPVPLTRDRAAAAGPRSADSARTASPFGDYADLSLQLNTRIETKVERDQNARCQSYQVSNPLFDCNSSFQPQLDFQFNTKTAGVVADRVHVDVDYDSQREFDASNSISVYYEGRRDELLQRLEVGNVSFTPPASRFLTAAVPSNNYGVQAIGQIGPMRFRTIAAQQKDNRVAGRVFTVGDRTLQNVDTPQEDYRFEPRRFFFTVDPRRLAGYPNVDILNGPRLRAIAASLPDELRPTQIYVYRQRIGEQPRNPNGPQFVVRGARNTNRLPAFELLQPNVDYYVDPTNLWIALVQPLAAGSERLVVAYRYAGQDTTDTTNAGGTPAIEYRQAPQVANLLYDPDVTPGDSAYFTREIRSVYRIGGDELRRATLTLKVVTGASGDQEKPAGGGADTYLQLFGLAQSSNSSTFDADNRLWPRPGDPNFSASGGGGKLIRDYFLVFPSLRPFARTGLATGGNPANDTLYATPTQDLYSAQRPPTLYTIRARYQADGGGSGGTLNLGGVQIARNSERLLVGSVPLRRDVDYTVDYETGMVTFLRPDTLFTRPTQVTAQYEENPLFASAPTTVLGLTTQFPTTNGELTFTAISQSQRTSFTRPPLGFEPASSLIMGVTASFQWDASAITHLLEKIPFASSSSPSAITLAAEFAASRPRPNSAGQAYVESFEGEGGISIPLNDPAWYYASQPALAPDGGSLGGLGAIVRDTARASTMSWQTTPRGRDGRPLQLAFEQIDPQVRFAGGAGSFRVPEQLLWLDLYPLRYAGLASRAAADTLAPKLRPEAASQWRTPATPSGRRWRAIRTSLGPGGADLSRVETLEFWALVDVTEAGRRNNPTLVFDFGDVSENTLSFAPESLCVGCAAARALGLDSLFTGKRVVGKDTLDSERDPLTRAFSVLTDDRGLPGDVAPRLLVQDASGAVQRQDSVQLCSANLDPQPLGVSLANCTVHNNRLDEEDLDFDGQLNGPDRVRRYVIDLARSETWARLGGSADSLGISRPGERLQWVYVRVPFRAPAESLGTADLRRVRAARVTVVSGADTPDSISTRVTLARLKLLGAPWVKRNERPLAGIAGERASPTVGGYVYASLIGTQDSTAGVPYTPPPGVLEQADTRQQTAGTQRSQVNERSLRVVAQGVGEYERGEAYYRFPEGGRNFMGYRQLRVWARGRGPGWGTGGDLQFYVKAGRDANNFYLYRTPVSGGDQESAWEPEVRVDFSRFFALRADLQNRYLQRGARSSCTGMDAELIARSFATPTDSIYAACDSGYVVVTIDPTTSPPNLANIQELAVGLVRLPPDGRPNRGSPADSVELWVDDVRLTDVVDTPGYAGQFAVGVTAGDVADFRVNVSRVDPNFRQLGDAPSFNTNSAVDFSGAIHLERLLPRVLGISLPLAMSYAGANTDPYFLQQSDVQGGGVAGLRTPKTGAASYSLTARRLRPMSNSLAGAILDNLSLTAGYAAGGQRSEYQDGRSANTNIALDYVVNTEPRTRPMPAVVGRAVHVLPGWAEGSVIARAIETSRIRWNPTALRFQSGLVQATDRRTSYTKPAAALGDSGRLVTGLSHVWRNSGDVELRPTGALTARIGVVSLRDLRRYDDSASTNGVPGRARAIAAARSRLGGMDVGYERNREMNATVSLQPVVTSWLRPRADLGSTFTMTRDPNAPLAGASLADSSGTGAADSSGTILPRRLSSAQSAATSVSLDLGRLVGALWRPAAAAIQPLEASYTRTVGSSFDGATFAAPFGYQFALGGPAGFRRVAGRLATSASVNRVASATQTVQFPLNVTLLNRFQRQGTRSWTFADDRQVPLDYGTTTFPSVSLRWSYRPASALLQSLVESLGANAGLDRIHNTSFAPSIVPGATAAASDQVTLRRPLNGSVVWAFAGGLSTNVSYTLATTEDQSPGRRNSSDTRDMAVDLGRRFGLPASWARGDGLTTRLGYQDTRTKTVALTGTLADGSPDRRPLVDNGRQAFTLNADTRVSPTVTLAIVGSRVVTFDNQLGRRFTQTVATVVFQMAFFAGELR